MSLQPVFIINVRQNASRFIIHEFLLPPQHSHQPARPLTVDVVLDHEGGLAEGLATEEPDGVSVDDGGVGGAAGRHVHGRRVGEGRQQLPVAAVLRLAAVRAWRR